MNSDEVMVMTDDELRIKASELTGEWYTCSMEDGVPCGLAYRFPHETDKGYQELPKYHNDIGAAWTLMEALRESTGKAMSIFFGLDMKDEYTVNVWWRNGRCAEVDDIVDVCAARAIAQAFILAMMASKESDEKEPMIRPD